MREKQPALFRGQYFQSELIILRARWYLRYPLRYRDLDEMMAQRGLSVDHSTIARWVLRYAPILDRSIRVETSQRFRSVDGALSSIADEAMNIIRKGQIPWRPKGDVAGQRQLAERVFGIAA